MEIISIVRDANGWAVKHRDGYLGHAGTLQEAASVGGRLVSWLEAEGRPAKLHLLEAGTFSAACAA